MILVDTSAWVEYDRATGSPVDRRLASLIETDGAIAVTEPVIMEVVSGAKTEQREQDLRRLLNRFSLLPFDPAVDFDGAVKVYRTCRRNGIAPRGLVDCMIAAVAIRRDAALLARDSDLVHVAKVMALRLDAATVGD